VGEAADGGQAVEQVAALKPDLVIMDILMPGMNGIEATRLIRKAHPATKILVLSMYDDEEYVQQLFSAGAGGYMLKRSDHQELLKAIRSVMSGGVPIDSQVAGKLVKDYLRRLDGEKQTLGSSGLSERERQVLGLVAEGLTNAQIAERLGLSRKTVDVHRTNLMRKLDIHDVTELVKFALRHGIIKLENK